MGRYFKLKQTRAIIEKDGLFIVKTNEMRTVHRSFEEACEAYCSVYGQVPIAGRIEASLKPPKETINKPSSHKEQSTSFVDLVCKKYQETLDKYEALKLLILLLLLFCSFRVEAQWLCLEASSQRSGSTVTSCGVGTSTSQEEARVKSRESAVEEFKRLCSLSSDCSGFDYTVVPKRTECFFLNQSFTCYRALEFQILDVKKSQVEIDPKDLDSQVKDLEIQIRHLNEIKYKEQEVSLKKFELQDLERSLNEKEAEEARLKDILVDSGYTYLHETKKNSLKLDLKIWDGRLTNQNDTEAFLDFTYERRFKRWFGLQGFIGTGSGNFKNQSDETAMETGPSNGTVHSNKQMGLVDVGGAMLIYTNWHGMYGKVEGGMVSGSHTSFDATYNKFGVGTVTSSTEQVRKSYIGESVGWDTQNSNGGMGMFGEVGFRNGGFVGLIGVNFGF